MAEVYTSLIKESSGLLSMLCDLPLIENNEEEYFVTNKFNFQNKKYGYYYYYGINPNNDNELNSWGKTNYLICKTNKLRSKFEWYLHTKNNCNNDGGFYPPIFGDYYSSEQLNQLISICQKNKNLLCFL